MSGQKDNIPRSQTPPAYTTLSARGLVAPNFPAYRTKSVTPAVQNVAWSCDARRLATCGLERHVRLWSPEKNLDERSTTALSGGFTSPVNAVAWNPTHPDLLCASGRQDKKMCFFDVRQKNPTQTLSVSGDIAKLEYSPDGQMLLALERPENDEKNDGITFFHLRQRVPDKESKAKSEWAQGSRKKLGSTHHAVFNHSGDIVFSAGGDGMVTMFDVNTLNVYQKTGCHVRSCYTLDFDPRGKYLATGGADAIVNLYDVSEWICIRTITTAESTVLSVAFSYDGEYLASGCDNYIDLTATETGQHIHRVQVPGTPTSLAWHPTQHSALAAAGERNVKGTGWLSLFGP